LSEDTKCLFALNNHMLISGGKQWQTTPKNLPRMQRTRAIPVDWLSSGLAQNRPKGWIPIIIIMLIRSEHYTELVG